MAQRPEQAGCRRASGLGPCDAYNPLDTVKSRLRTGIGVAGAPCAPEACHFMATMILLAHILR
jgi:hypothetical protein